MHCDKWHVLPFLTLQTCCRRSSKFSTRST
jgi:hypothetical protein